MGHNGYVLEIMIELLKRTCLMILFFLPREHQTLDAFFGTVALYPRGLELQVSYLKMTNKLISKTL